MPGFHLIPDNVRRGQNQIVQRSNFRRSRVEQIFHGVQVNGFVVIGEQPERIRGVLCWKCACPAGHQVNVAASDLMYNTAPTCSQCIAPTIRKAVGLGETEEEKADWMRRHRVPRRKDGTSHKS